MGARAGREIFRSARLGGIVVLIFMELPAESQPGAWDTRRNCRVRKYPEPRLPFQPCARSGHVWGRALGHTTHDGEVGALLKTFSKEKKVERGNAGKGSQSLGCEW
jgi:hypothetical protein